MFELHTQTSLCAAHRIEGHQGKCRFLHGHNWRVVATIAGPSADDLVARLPQIREVVLSAVDRFDHTYLNELPEFQSLTTTAESISMVLYQKIAAALLDLGRLSKVTVWETSKYAASYSKASMNV